MDDDNPPVDLLGIERSPSSENTATWAAPRWPVLWVLVTVIAVVIAWLLGSSGSDPTPPAGTALDEPAVGLELEHAGRAIGVDQTTTTEHQPTTSQPPPLDVEPIDPQSPLSLIIADRDRLQVVSFATGEVAQFAQPGDVVGVFGDYLVLRRGPKLGAVPLADLARQPIDLPVSSIVDVVAAEEPNHVWGFEPTESDDLLDGRVVLIDLATGQLRDRLEDDVDVETFGRPGWPTLTTGIGGGVYEKNGTGYQQRAEGVLRVANERYALVEACDETYQCASQWLDRRTWEPVPERHAPESGTFFDGRLVGGGRVLVFDSSPTLDSVVVLDVVTGARLDVRYLRGFGLDAVAVGPEGQWVASGDYDRFTTTVQTLDGDTRVHLPWMAVPGGLVIAELP